MPRWTDAQWDEWERQGGGGHRRDRTRTREQPQETPPSGATKRPSMAAEVLAVGSGADAAAAAAPAEEEEVADDVTLGAASRSQPTSKSAGLSWA